MKYLALSGIFLITLVSCQDYSQFIKGDRKATIIPNRVSISSAEVSDWRVGPLRRQEVSKGLRIKLDFPQLEKEHLLELVKIIEIDSWVIRIKRKTLITSETLDSFYVPLLVPGRGKRDLRVKQISAGFINLYYSAAAISTRFEKFQCPAFDHKRVITDFEVIDTNGREDAIRGDKVNASLVSGKMVPYSYRPFPVNAGSEMSGEYHFEIALYNAKEKLRKSNWFELHQAVKVNKEKEVVIKGCKNFKIPKNDSRQDGIQDFQFGR
jgi:hypothetical protein